MKETCAGRWQDLVVHTCRLPSGHAGECSCPCGARGVPEVWSESREDLSGRVVGGGAAGGRAVIRNAETL